ncbi:hypothetical protein TRSC58_03845 [Trypanosoma rangeli SC58]|uniref:Regulator of microtubule dynamics protein 1 n=1 Tax=Trypanosoma rangeli SC58 TaxID=429131 RepID=A0A061J570_TRYRA|nr:hypothetical protein TRSC58_03845 [Trypanosoma rangeli SC58]
MSSWEQVVQEADQATKAKDITAAHKILHNAIEGGLHHPQISWRYARSLYEMGEETTDKKVRQTYFKKGLEWGKKAVEEDSNTAAAHKWFSILLSAQNEFVGSREKVANAYIIRDHFLKALELDKDDATAQHCMGMWCWNVLRIGWVERQAATLLFGAPPTSTPEECLKYLLAADALEPTIRNCLAIGDAYLYQNQKVEAKVWFQKAIDLPATTQANRRQQENAKKKLASC